MVLSTVVPGLSLAHVFGQDLFESSWTCLFVADSSLWTMTLRCQIENLAHDFEDRGGLTSYSNRQQHFHGCLEHLFYDASTKRLDNILLVRAEIAQATAHPTNFIAAHCFKTLF